MTKLIRVGDNWIDPAKVTSIWSPDSETIFFNVDQNNSIQTFEVDWDEDSGWTPWGLAAMVNEGR